MAYVVKCKPALMLKGDRRPYLLDGFKMTWTTKQKAKRFRTESEALDYLVKHGWDREDNGLEIVRLVPPKPA